MKSCALKGDSCFEQKVAKVESQLGLRSGRNVISFLRLWNRSMTLLICPKGIEKLQSFDRSVRPLSSDEFGVA
jgi:hypothetical protein